MSDSRDIIEIRVTRKVGGKIFEQTLALDGTVLDAYGNPLEALWDRLVVLRHNVEKATNEKGNG